MRWKTNEVESKSENDDVRKIEDEGEDDESAHRKIASGKVPKCHLNLTPFLDVVQTRRHIYTLPSASENGLFGCIGGYGGK